MIIGKLGGIIFEVSDDTIKTIRDATMTGSASLSVHKRHLNKGLVEFTGSDPKSFTFSVRISKYLGADPLEDIDRLDSYTESGIALYLSIGNRTYGSYKWMIEKYKTKLEHYDGSGNLITVDVALTLTEYGKR